MRVLADNVSCKYGAPMGRSNFTLRANGEPVYTIENGRAEYMEALRQQPRKFYLQDARVSGGYDRGGAYWGDGQRVYLAESLDGRVFRSFRADDRMDAFAQLRDEFPGASIFGVPA